MARKTIAGLEAVIDGLKETLDEWVKSYSRLNTEHQELIGENQKLNNERQELISEGQELNIEYQELISEYQKLNNEHQKLISERQELNTEYCKLIIEHQELNDELKELREKLVSRHNERNAGRKGIIDEDLIQAVRELKMQGMTQKLISERLSVAIGTVNKVLKVYVRDLD